MKTLTVFTPTYNRAYCLPQLYKSLKKQTFNDFSWIVVDDGSTDETKDLVNKWIKEANFEIVYFYQQNGGKMRAFNFAVKNTITELFLCIDSDDYLVDSAVEEIVNEWNKIREEQNIQVSGLVSYRGLSKDKLIGNPMPNIEFSTLSGLYEKGFSGDSTIVFRTSVIKQYPFPEIEGEKFITEGYVYDQIDQNYQFCLFPKILTICKYLEDGYSINAYKLYQNNPIGWALYFKQSANFSRGIGKELMNYIKYCGFSMLAKKKVSFSEVKNKLLLLFSIPLGFIVFCKRKMEYRHNNIRSNG